MYLRLSIAVFALLLAGLVVQPSAGLQWEPDRRATQDNSGAGQNEPFIAAHPSNPDNAVAVSKDFREGRRNRIYTTIDGGVSWLEQPFPDAGPAITADTDPAVFFRPDGRAYLLWTAIIDWPNAGIFTAWSDDGGLTWSPATAITPPTGHFDDKAWMAFDNTGGLYRGTIYTAWTRFGDAEIYASRSTDGGVTWAAPVPVSRDQWLSANDGPQIQVLPNGTVLIIYLHNSSPGTVGTLVSTRSMDGGASYGPNNPLFTIVQPPYTVNGESWRIFTYHSLVRDPVRGVMTMIWQDYRQPANGIDILLSRSMDEGVTWSPATRLNDDPEGLLRDQWFPALAVAPDGRLTALWLDRREDPSNRLYHAYSRTSTDGGLSWSPGTRVSSTPSDPNVNIPEGADGIGDYIGISAARGVVWGAWPDTRNGDQDIYAARELFTHMPPPTATPTLPPSATSTPRPATATPPAPSPTPCTIRFSDVPEGAYFYEPVRYLYCLGSVGGYEDNTFRPYNYTTRGQTTKIVVIANRLPVYTPAVHTFADTPPGSTFYSYVETAVREGLVGGYPCGNPEPCDPQGRPVFRPNALVTRAQVSKVVVLAAGWEPVYPPSPTFADVPPENSLYGYVEAAASRGLIGGYPCGNPEPCDPANRPVFRPGNSATRGQIAKIVYEAVTR